MMPAFEHRLNTNYVPTPGEATDIKNILKSSEERLRGLSLQIVRSQDRCNQLSLEKERLRAGINNYRSVVAPVRRLIPEILQEIFCHCLPISCNAVMKSNEAPLLLGRVCSQWRQVAYSTPRLWTSIHIVIPSSEPYVPDKLTDDSKLLLAISSWLSRSGALPLSISFRSYIYSSDPSLATNPRVRPFLELLTSFTHRWKFVSFTIEHYDWSELFSRYSANEMPLLEKIHLDGVQIPIAIPGVPHPPGFAAATRENGILRAPRLRWVSLSLYGEKILQLPIRWNELLGLDLSLSTGPLSLQATLNTLGLCPKLLSCSIYLSDWNSTTIDDELNPPPKVVLPKLEALTLIDDTNMPALFGRLVTPELRHLALRPSIMGAYNNKPFLKGLDTFLHGLIHPLQELDLEGNSLEEDSLVRILEMVPGLTRLSITNYGRVEASTEDWLPSVPRAIPTGPSLTDSTLRRFVPEILNTGVQPAHPSLSIDDDDDDDDDDDASNGGPELEVDGSTPDEACERLLAHSSIPDKKLINQRLVPNLRILHCSRAMFTESVFLGFLCARSLRHSQLGVAHLRGVSVSFMPGRRRSEDFVNRVLELCKTTGMGVHLTYPKPLTLGRPQGRDPYSSPYRGIDTAEDFYYPPVHLGFW